MNTDQATGVRTLAEIQTFWTSVSRTVQLTDLEKRAVEDITELASNITMLVAALESEQQESAYVHRDLRALKARVDQLVTVWRGYNPHHPSGVLELVVAINRLDILARSV